MTQITLNINDKHLNFFLELIKRFDFVKLESKNQIHELTQEQKDILDQRLDDYKNNPDSYLNWEDVKGSIKDRYNA